MSINLLRAIQERLGSPEIKKIDPNTQEAKTTMNDFAEEDKLNQAAIPAVLIAMYKYSRTEEGAKEIFDSELRQGLRQMLGSTQKEAVEKVASYANVPIEEAEEQMELVTKEAVNVIRENKPATPNAVQHILAAQRNDILTHLPAVLQMGDLLKDNTIDDRTNKMQGPVSTLMNALGGSFSGTEKTKQVN